MSNNSSQDIGTVGGLLKSFSSYAVKALLDLVTETMEQFDQRHVSMRLCSLYLEAVVYLAE